MSQGLAQVLGMLRCPHCDADLELDRGAVMCTSGHAFDVARQGYVNLLRGNHKAPSSDTAEMVEAREAFLSGGHYHPVAEAVAGAVACAVDQAPVVLEVGAGTAYYLAEVVRRDTARVGLALDASKHAARRAAGAHDRIASVVSDVWRPFPVRDAAVDVVLDVFAPRNGPEMRRVLRSGGVLIVVTPNVDHLRELVELLGLLRVDADKGQRVASSLAAFALANQRSVSASMQLDANAIEALVAMGPSAWHTDAQTVAERLEQRGVPASVTLSVNVAVYRPR